MSDRTRPRTEGEVRMEKGGGVRVRSRHDPGVIQEVRKRIRQVNEPYKEVTVDHFRSSRNS